MFYLKDINFDEPLTTSQYIMTILQQKLNRFKVLTFIFLQIYFVKETLTR